MSTTYEVGVDTKVTTEEILYVRGEGSEKTEEWNKCLQQSLAVIAARETQTGKLVGVAFLVGNVRHGLMVDMVVHPSARGNHIGSRLFDNLVSQAKSLGITYISLTYDTKKPWLKDFYERHGFRSIDFAMWEESSLSALGD
jgi:N-acetylglutamate synthase-like GNAT family acetyltransferase